MLNSSERSSSVSWPLCSLLHGRAENPNSLIMIIYLLTRTRGSERSSGLTTCAYRKLTRRAFRLSASYLSTAIFHTLKQKRIGEEFNSSFPAITTPEIAKLTNDNVRIAQACAGQTQRPPPFGGGGKSCVEASKCPIMSVAYPSNGTPWQPPRSGCGRKRGQIAFMPRPYLPAGLLGLTTRSAKLVTRMYKVIYRQEREIAKVEV